jgi:hypothetical protein
MNFKKDYINYVLHNVLQSENTSGNAAGRVLESIIANEDFFKITFVVGKTAGLEILFKYLLYISDKVDKSQITIFNLKDNYEYDVNNIKRIYGRLQLKDLPETQAIDEIAITKSPDLIISEDKELMGVVTSGEEITDEENTESSEEQEENIADTGEDGGMSLLENKESDSAETHELFELDTISRSIESHSIKPKQEASEKESEEDKKVTSNKVTDTENVSEEESAEHSDEVNIEIRKSSFVEDNIDNDEESELEIEVRKPTEAEEIFSGKQEIKEEITERDEFNKFEQKYREEIKILEKLLSYVEKEYTFNGFKGFNERTLKSFNEIIEISNELAELTRQLSFDLVADIFYTLNMYFTRAAGDPDIISLERLKLFDSSLAIVSSLIKGESYMDYSDIIDKVEALKRFLAKPIITRDELSASMAEKIEETQEVSAVKRIIELPEIHETGKRTEEEDILIEKPKVNKQSAESIIFKMKYLVKEFEKNFASLENIKGEYSKFTALEKVDELNSYLRMIAKIAAAVKLKDILNLAEVSYVFLKYLKDYRMDLMDSEIQQIIKYIIFTFKMLMTDRKPEDFNVLVQYLNNPVKIFADSN